MRLVDEDQLELVLSQAEAVSEELVA